jgi:hypothetical protein
MARRLAWAAVAVVLVYTAPAAAKKVRPAVELGYDGLLMAGQDLDFRDPLYGGTLGLLMSVETKNPLLIRVRFDLHGARWETQGGKDRLHMLGGVMWNVGLGLGRGRNVMPFVEVGLGPQFLSVRKSLKSKLDDWAWTVALEGQFGLIFRMKKGFGLRMGVGFSSVSFYSRNENLGGLWMSASLVFGLPKDRYEPPYYEPHYEPPPYAPPPSAGDFYFDAWVVNQGGDAARPVLTARIVRDYEFDDEVDVSVELPDGSEFEMHRGSLEDPDFYELPLYILPIECGSQTVTVKGKSGWIERTLAVSVYEPCPQAPGGM